MNFRENRWLQYLSVVLSILIIVLLESNVSIVAKGLLGTPLLVVVAGATILSDYTASILAIALGAAAVNYISGTRGLGTDSTSVFATLEFLLAGFVVFLLTMRGNRYRSSNVQLIAGSQQLQAVIKKLKRDVKMTSEQVDKLNAMNDELKVLVDEFIADDNYWESRWPAKSDKASRTPKLPKTKLRHR